MSIYQKQGFYSGGKLKASQLEAIEDGIINAEKLAMEAASQGAQSDYNENDSAAASYIKNRPFYEGNVYEPITWDGVVGDRETVDVSAILEGGLLVKVKDEFLTYEELLNSVSILNDGTQIVISENSMVSKEEGDVIGGYGLNSSVISCFDPEKAQATMGISLSVGIYFLYSPSQNLYVSSLSKTTIKKIDEKFLPELASGANMEKGTGDTATQQTPRADKVTQAEGETAPHFSFTGHQEAGMQGRIQYGAIGNYSASMNGRSAALNKHAFAINNSTVAKGEESFAQGYETIAEGNGSSAMGSKTWAEGTHSHTEGENTHAVSTDSHAEGSDTKAVGRAAHTEGEGTETNGAGAHAEGNNSKAMANSAHAEGNGTQANTEASHTEGAGTQVSSFMSIKPDSGFGDSGDQGDGTNNDLSEAKCGHAEGNNTSVMAYAGHAEGVGTQAWGHASHAEGFETQTGLFKGKILEDGSTIYEADLDYGSYSHAEGYRTIASGRGSHTEGIATRAVGVGSHAGGLGTYTQWDYSTAIGKYNDVYRPFIFAVGNGEESGAEMNKGVNALEVTPNNEVYIIWRGNYISLQKVLNILADTLPIVNDFIDAID